MKKDHYLNLIIHSAEQYQLNLSQKTILIVYKGYSEIAYIELQFKKENFMHLTGVKSELHAIDFFENCINNKLNPNAFQATSNTPQKLSALKIFMDLPRLSATIGEPVQSRLNLRTDIIIAKYQSILCLVKEKYFYYPQSVLNRVNPKHEMSTQHPILMTCIRSTKIRESMYEITHVNKNISINDILCRLPAHLRNNISH